MKKLSLFIMTFIISAIITSGSSVAFATDSEWTEIPPSETYIDYLENPDKYEIIPPYYDAKTADGQKRGIQGVPKAEAPVVLPEKYDVRSEGIAPLIKDQGADSTCSFFAVSGNCEILAALNNDTRYFSDYHAKQALAQNFSDGINYYGFDRNPADGLHLRWVSPYYINGRGPVPLSFSSYLTGNTTVASSYINSAKPEIQTQEIQLLPGLGEDATQAEIDEWLTELKTLVYQYGSVSITMTSDGYHSDSTGVYFYCSEMPEYHDHAVLCVGWDDTIPAENFTNRYGETPTVDGGLIFQNSWGTYWGESGYGYISYGSQGLSLQDFQLVSAYREREDDEVVRTYSELGSNSLIGKASSQSKWFGNKFYLDKGEYVNLKEINFYAPLSDVRYDVYVSPTGSVERDDYIYVDSVTPERPGYYSVSADFDLGGEDMTEFFVVVKSNCGSTQYAIPVEGLSTDFSNIRNRYLSYYDDQVLTTVPYAISTAIELNQNNVEWWEIYTGFVAVDNEDLAAYTASNIAVNAITEPFKAEIIPTAAISANKAICGDEITVSTTVEGDGSGNYSYDYKLFLDGECIEESYGSTDSYSFIAAEAGEYYVEVTVTDTTYNVSSTATTQVVTVYADAFAVDFEVIDNADGTFTVQGGTVYPTENVSYSTYVLSNGSILHKSVYQTSVSTTFTVDSVDSFTVIVYAQNADRTRVSKVEKITL